MFAFVLTGKNISNGEVNIRLHVFDRIWLKCNFHLYRLLLQQLPLVGIFEGDPHCLYFSHNIGMLEKGIYKLAGQAIAWSLLHDGPGFPAFHPYLFDMMCGVRGNNSIKITDIRDEEALRNIQMVITSWATRFIIFGAVGVFADEKYTLSIYVTMCQSTSDLAQSEACTAV